MIFFDDLEALTGGKNLQRSHNLEIGRAITDSRKAIPSKGSLFFAIKGKRHDGHAYIQQLYNQGVRQFVVEKELNSSTMHDANVILVHSAVEALQSIAAHHRIQFNIPVIGIAGSNGKTIVKEWLFQLLSGDKIVMKTPGSYNSQIGVPLSVMQLRAHHEIAVIEAGISMAGEMVRLAKVVQPTIGIFTNIGSAHESGFASIEEKVREKLSLFADSKLVIYRKDHQQIDEEIKQTALRTLAWGTHPESDIVIVGKGASYSLSYAGQKFNLELPFSDNASVENCMHCVATMLALGYHAENVAERLKGLRSVAMRLELKEGINQCQLIDDTYNNDLVGLQISLDFLSHQQFKKRKTVILSDILQSGLEPRLLVSEIAGLMQDNNVSFFVGVGEVLSKYAAQFEIPSLFFKTTEEFLVQFDRSRFNDELILVKGARRFGFERIVTTLQKRVHGTIMEIELGALVHNLNFFRSKLNPETKIMAMVKAFAYGSGSLEIASLLQYHQVDYLGVAYVDEGVELRMHNIRLPIMVMSPSVESFDKLLLHRLEPEIFSLGILRKLILFLNGRRLAVHLKIDTGMHRLGFMIEELPEVVGLLRENKNVEVASVFSHLAGADEQSHDSFSKQQAKQFEEDALQLSQALGYKPLFHLLNSMGSLRLTQYQFDMVRLGIGLYGIDEAGQKGRLRSVLTLKTFVSQIKMLRAGETIGYGRKGAAHKAMRMAVVAIGYADGYSRAFSEGKGLVLIRGKRAPVIGMVCMDMTMVDVTDVDAEEGDEVIIFGEDLPVEEISNRIGTIPYEIFTSTSDRVKRIFWAESI